MAWGWGLLHGETRCELASKDDQYGVGLRDVWKTPVACPILLPAALDTIRRVLPIFLGLGAKSRPTLAAEKLRTHL